MSCPDLPSTWVQFGNSEDFSILDAEFAVRSSRDHLAATTVIVQRFDERLPGN